jgi:hypothetical protein
MSGFEHYIEIVRDWKMHWQMREGKDYFRRAFGVDSNMVHDLARMLDESDEGRQSSMVKKLVKALLKVRVTFTPQTEEQALVWNEQVVPILKEAVGSTRSDAKPEYLPLGDWIKAKEFEDLETQIRCHIEAMTTVTPEEIDDLTRLTFISIRQDLEEKGLV